MAGTYYCNCSTIGGGCTIYNDACLSSPVGAGYYSNGTNCFQTNSSGYIVNVTSCVNAIPAYSGGDTTSCIGSSSVTLYTYNSSWTGFTNGEIIRNSDGTTYNGGGGLFSENNYCTYANISSTGVVSGAGVCSACA